MRKSDKCRGLCNADERLITSSYYIPDKQTEIPHLIYGVYFVDIVWEP